MQEYNAASQTWLSYSSFRYQTVSHTRISCHKNKWSTLSTQCEHTVDKVILGYNKFEQSMENSSGPVHDLS